MNIPPGIDARTGADGTTTYRVRIRIKDKRPVSKTFKCLTHAKRWKRIKEAEIEKGTYLSYAEAEQHTLKEAIQRYEKSVLPTKPRDAHNVARHLARWKKELGHLKLSSLTPSVIAEVRDRMLCEEVRGQKNRSNATVSRYLASLSHVLSLAVKEWQWLHENPCLKVKKPKEAPGCVRYLSKNELSALLQACQSSRNPDLYLIVLIALTTGARKSEILELTWKDIDFDHCLFHFRDTKNGEDRSVPTSEQIIQILKRRPQSHSLLFPSEANPEKPCCIRSAWEAALKRAKIADFRFHDLRHTTGSYLAMAKTSLREIGEILGHKTLQMTKRYSHLSYEHKRTLVEKMESLITIDHEAKNE